MPGEKKVTKLSRLKDFLFSFIQLEGVSGFLLFFSAFFAFILANSPYKNFYYDFITRDLAFFNFKEPILLWVNDGLMVLFFFLVSLEIKREILEGELNHVKKAMFPSVAALGGVLGPALIYWLVNKNSPETMNGWAIPTATDIAFSLAVLSLVGKKVPTALKAFLMALAIIDDLVAIFIIALFYTKTISLFFLFLALLCFFGLCYLNKKQIFSFWPYAVMGIFLWVFILNSGIHPTLAGVVVAFTYPLRLPAPRGDMHYHWIENTIHPWVAFLILPLFAFVNSGVSFSNINSYVFLSPLYLGIFFGLFLGKPLGIMGIVWSSVKAGIFQLPHRITWTHLWGLSFICGIGFTMSLFIGSLAFADQIKVDSSLIRMGVLSGSLFSGIIGFLLLRRGIDRF